MRFQSQIVFRVATRVVFAGVSAAFLAGCADSDRFGSDPLGNPFGSQARAPQAQPRTSDYAQSAPVAPVQSHPLSAPVQSRPLGPTASLAAPSRQSPHLASAAPLPSAPETTASMKRNGPTGWSAEGGMPVVVANGETADMIGKRYGVPTDALLRANGMSSAAQVHPGTRLVIPVYNAALSASSGARMASAAPVAPPIAAPTPSKAKEQMHFVRGAEPAAAPSKVATHKPEQPTHVAAAATAKAPLPTKVAAVEPPKPSKPAKVEAPVKAHAVAKLEKPAEVQAPVAAPIKVAKVEAPVVKKVSVDPTPTASLPPPTAETPKVADAAGPEFRWPARGRIIQGFKTGGNDGINIAVPEGTQVKAAENGVVAYAGSELKGYGNLVLIRHPNGFVTAYANNGNIEVKRGDTVKRGQTIATSGQSGNVASPQLHFELRKGSTPVDPTQYLAGL